MDAAAGAAGLICYIASRSSILLRHASRIMAWKCGYDFGAVFTAALPGVNTIDPAYCGGYCTRLRSAALGLRNAYLYPPVIRLQAICHNILIWLLAYSIYRNRFWFHAVFCTGLRKYTSRNCLLTWFRMFCCHEFVV